MVLKKSILLRALQNIASGTMRNKIIELIKDSQALQSDRSEAPPAWLSELAQGVHKLNASPDELKRLSSRAPTGIELKVDAQRSLRDAIKSAVSSP